VPAGRKLELTLGAIVVVADQITKAVVRQTLPQYESVSLLPGFIDLTHVRNTGAAFGLFNAVQFPLKPAVMLVVALLALAAIAVYAAQLREEERMARSGLALVLGGAIGNLIDRAATGYVLDFVDVYYGGAHFWAFNVADAAISVGAALVIIDVLFSGSTRRPETPEREPHVSGPV
jgi:signal peptidase II